MLSDLQTQIDKARDVKRADSALGQWIGKLIDRATHVCLEEIVESSSLGLSVLPEQGGRQVRLPDDFGDLRQIDHAVCAEKILLICESKWLKDKRHLNDKGSWIRLLADVAEVNEIAHVMLVLAGPWESYRSRMERRGFKVSITPVAEVYEGLREHGVDITIDESREAFDHPEEALTSLLDVLEGHLNSGVADPVALLGGTILQNQIPEICELFLESISSPSNQPFGRKATIGSGCPNCGYTGQLPDSVS